LELNLNFGTADVVLHGNASLREDILSALLKCCYVVRNLLVNLSAGF
jgi:hypothetical protein